MHKFDSLLVRSVLELSGHTAPAQITQSNLFDGFDGETYLGNNGDVIRVTPSFSEALVASSVNQIADMHMPTHDSPIEIEDNDSGKVWLLKMEGIQLKHPLINQAAQLIGLSNNVDDIESFDFNFSSEKNEWVSHCDLSEVQISKIIQDLQNTLISFEMNGFIHTHLDKDNLAVKVIDGAPCVICLIPQNDILENTYQNLNKSISDLNGHSSIEKLNLSQCLGNTVNIQMEEHLEYNSTEYFSPSNPISLSR